MTHVPARLRVTHLGGGLYSSTQTSGAGNVGVAQLLTAGATSCHMANARCFELCFSPPSFAQSEHKSHAFSETLSLLEVRASQIVAASSAVSSLFVVP